MPPSPRSLVDLPKAHLHLHFEGAMRPGTLAELCDRHGTSRPTVGGAMGTFDAFQELYDVARSSLTTSEDMTRLAREIVEDGRRDGAVWVEIAVNVWDHPALGSPSELLAALVGAGEEAAAENDVGVGWIVTADRTRSPELAVEQAHLAAAFAGRGVVAFGLANDEAASPPELFAEAFGVARDAGLLCAPHAGEHRGPEAVRSAVEELRADRVQHGVRAVDDPGVVDLLATVPVCLDVCPTSNVCLSVVPDLDAHPLRDLIRAGVPCSVNADDPLLFGPGLVEEYELCRDVLGCTDEELASCARASIFHSGAPGTLKERASTAIDRWLTIEPERVRARPERASRRGRWPD
jgi:adenosine deaminase